MKTFKEIAIGEYVYIVNEDNKIVSLQVEGIRNIGLKGIEYKLHLVGSMDVTVKADSTTCYDRTRETHIHASQESVQAARKANKEIFISRQLRIALCALRKIKSCDHDLSKSRKRIEQLFQIVEKEQVAD